MIQMIQPKISQSAFYVRIVNIPIVKAEKPAIKAFIKTSLFNLNISAFSMVLIKVVDTLFSIFFLLKISKANPFFF